MIPMQLPIDTLLTFDGNKVTDHGRAELSVATEKLMNEKRMVTGTLRRYIVAEKRTWSISWENLFSKDAGVIDGYWSGESMLAFYKSTPGEFVMTIEDGRGGVETVTVMSSSFDHSVIKRSQSAHGDLWALNLEVVEV